MLTIEIAQVFGALRTGSDRWMGNCPAHHDHSPSLSIRNSRAGRTLINCWAGCPLTDVLKAVGLRQTDLFDGLSPSSEQLNKLALQQEVMTAEKMEMRFLCVQLTVRVRRLQAVVKAVGAKLARTPELAPEVDERHRFFHVVCDKLHRAEVQLQTYEKARVNGPSRKALLGD